MSKRVYIQMTLQREHIHSPNAQNITLAVRVHNQMGGQSGAKKADR